MGYNPYKEGKKEGWSSGVIAGYSAATATFMWLLRSKHGWGQKRLCMFLKEAMKFSKENIEVDDKTVTPGRYGGIGYNDILDSLKDEVGLHFDLKKGTYYFTDKDGRIVTYEYDENH